MPKKPAATNRLKLLEPFWNERPTRTVLPNGLTVLVKSDASAPVVSVQVWVKTGSIHEADLLGSGVSHFLEHMLFKGTERRAGREISSTVQAHGGYINAYTTFDRTVYYVDLPVEHFGVAVDLLADIALHSTLPADEVEREKQVILREIDMVRDDPDQRLAESLFATAYRQHPFRYPIIGHREVFAALTRDDLLAYYRGRYAVNNLVVAVAGAVDPDHAVAEVSRHFGDAPRRKLAPVLVPTEPLQLAARDWSSHEEVELTRGGLAWHIPGMSHADAPALDLLATILGGGDSSVLWQAVREKAQLVHAISASSWTPEDPGLFYISFTCDPEKRAKALVSIERTLTNCLRTGFTPAQIDKAMRQLAVGEINSRKTISGQAARLGLAEVVAGDLDFSRAYFRRLETVKSADLRRVMGEYLAPSRQTAVSIRPKSTQSGAPGYSVKMAAEPEFTQEVLANGAKLLLHEDKHLPNLHLRVVLAGGALFEDSAERGATTLLATLLTKDTKKRSAAEVAEKIEAVGGSFFPFSGNNSFGVALDVLPDDLDLGLTLLEEALLTPAFLAETMEIERAAQISELQQDKDDVVAFGRKQVRKKFFGAYPLAIESGGEEEGLRRVTPKSLAALWRRYFVAGNVIVSVAGDFDRRKLEQRLRKWLRQFPKGTLAAPNTRFTGPAAVGDFVETQPREQAVVFQAFPSPGLRDADFYIGEVADELFSGMSSRLFERVREERGLAYFVRSSRILGSDTGMFVFLAGTSPAQYEAVLTEIDAEIARICGEGATDEELRRCRTRLKAARRMGLQTNSAKAVQAALNVLHGYPPDDWKNYDGYIDAVTAERLQAFARKYFRPEVRTQLVVKP